MKLLALYWSLLRYRVAVMIILFMLLGAAWHRGLTTIEAPVFLMIVALASSYVSATSVNDIADKEIDEINHPGDRGRPLVTGAARTRDLWVVFSATSVLAVSLALADSLNAAGIVLLAVVSGVLYSMGPVRLSYRIILKDFRDREGDAAYGKPTFLLTYGKRATCLASLGAICAGDALLIASLA